ncbi:hypothetical protein [Adhaeribacter terreus]|uniref:Uncharacterized protein n=1 Tax=Adhaeribacter terreus TaxID=529703 RepID=A0ABW0EGK0_9BACT
MKLFFAALKFISLKDFKDESIELVPGLLLTQSPKVKREILSEKNRAIIGVIDSNFIQQSDALLYYKFEENDDLFAGLTNLLILETVLKAISNV